MVGKSIIQQNFWTNRSSSGSDPLVRSIPKRYSSSMSKTREETQEDPRRKKPKHDGYASGSRAPANNPNFSHLYKATDKFTDQVEEDDADALPNITRNELQQMPEAERLEYKRLRNRLAARVCRKKKMVIKEKLQKEVEVITLQLTKSVTQRYQLQCKIRTTEEENNRLQAKVEKLQLQNKRYEELLKEVLPAKSTSTTEEGTQEEDVRKKTSVAAQVA